jgi:predicted nucleic acid-binding protein
MIYYLDASALVKEFVYERGSEKVVNIINSGYPIYSSVVVYPETLFALRRKKHEEEITEDEFNQKVTKIEDRWQSLNIVKLNQNILSLLRDRVIRYPLRALDAIHLASAIWIRRNIDADCKFVCSDDELIKYSRDANLEIINPELE